MPRKFFLSACLIVGIAVSDIPNAGEAREPTLTVEYIKTHAQALDGRTITVRGYALLGPEAHSLFHSAQRFAVWSRGFEAADPSFNPHDYDDDCLTIENANFASKHRRLDRRTVTLRGRIDARRVNYTGGDGAYVFDPHGCGNPGLWVDETALDAR